MHLSLRNARNPLLVAFVWASAGLFGDSNDDGSALLARITTLNLRSKRRLEIWMLCGALAPEVYSINSIGAVLLMVPRLFCRMKKLKIPGLSSMVLPLPC